MIQKGIPEFRKDIDRAIEFLHSPGRHIALITHVNPDGDAIGSSLGLLRVLENFGHTCTAIVPNDFPRCLKWMAGADRVLRYDLQPGRTLDKLKEAEMIIALDFNEIGRIKRLADEWHNLQAFRLLIDHHPGIQAHFDSVLSDQSASSTAELVYRFITECSLLDRMDREAAECLFSGIMTDTGCFSYNSSSPLTWRIVAELIAMGIDKDAIYHQIYDNYSAGRMRLLGFTLHERMEVLPEYRTAYLWLSTNDLQRFGFVSGDSEGFVNYPLSIEGIRFSAFFVEKEDHIKVSFRSKGKVDVNQMMRRIFQGGGHVNASGGECNESLGETISRFRAALPGYKAELNHEA